MKPEGKVLPMIRSFGIIDQQLLVGTSWGFFIACEKMFLFKEDRDFLLEGKEKHYEIEPILAKKCIQKC